MSRGFTLIELAAVMVVVSIIAVSAAPVLSRVADTRTGALAGEVERLLGLARSRALSSGNPAGVRFDQGDQTLELVEAPEGVALRSFMETYDIPQRAMGTRLASVTIGDNQSTLWFASDATPHTRSDAGVFIENIDEDAAFAVEGGPTVLVEMNSGRIYR